MCKYNENTIKIYGRKKVITVFTMVSQQPGNKNRQINKGE